MAVLLFSILACLNLSAQYDNIFKELPSDFQSGIVVYPYSGLTLYGKGDFYYYNTNPQKMDTVYSSGPMLFVFKVTEYNKLSEAHIMDTDKYIVKYFNDQGYYNIFMNLFRRNKIIVFKKTEEGLFKRMKFRLVARRYRQNTFYDIKEKGEKYPFVTYSNIVVYYN